ncbi:phosphodiesterase [Sporocytophaga myxococcoides]|uniref:Phosphodiesterase n=1 Tax=Sporocytophaga myxococcoides TaxID=153721 RepID=A0A098L965_9BACT|nr:alkaline phosphatase D family protein [Sporocytophaga myxococcoides]GAL82889.1 phosphodiesterase [Sporocytophaga myxococcoides]
MKAFIANLFILLLSLSSMVFAQNGLLHSGPMPGFSGKNHVLIWLQTKEPATAYLKYWISKNTAGYLLSPEIVSDKESGNTFHFDIRNLKSGERYQYEVYINNIRQELEEPLYFRTQFDSAVSEEFSFATGSCAYTKEPDTESEEYRGIYNIYNSIADLKPDFMLWLGDNVYFENTDIASKQGMLHRYTFSRGNPYLQKLLRTSHHYAIWDDHDFGPNDADSSFKNKAISNEMFNLFWCNNDLTRFNRNNSIANIFSWNDADFFLLDDRTFRAPAKSARANKQLLGKEQIEWLIKELKGSKASFKFIAMGGQMLNPDKVFENYSRYKKEWKYFLSELDKSGVGGVILLTGDRHFSEVTMMPRENNYPLYELTSSPLTSSIAKREMGHNKLRIEGSLTAERNFSIITIGGEGEKRFVNMISYSNSGKPLWERKIYKSEIY